MASEVVSYKGERPTIDWFITLQGEPKHTVGCLREDNHQAVPKNPRVGIKGHSLWYRLSDIPREATRLTRAPPVASRETHPKSSDSEIPHRLIKVLGLPVPFPTSALSTFKHLTHESHWTGAHIPCSYHMSNPFKEIL
jgi:hypothetical protein